MPKSKEQKKEIISKLQDNIERQKAVYAIDYKGLKADDLFRLRQEVQRVGGLLLVSKKTLVQRAFQSKGIPFDNDFLSGQLALIFSFEDEVAPIKVAYSYTKKDKVPQIMGGVIEGNLFSKEYVLELAQLPSKKELHAKVVGILQAPLANLRNSLEYNIKGLLMILQAKKA